MVCGIWRGLWCVAFGVACGVSHVYVASCELNAACGKSFVWHVVFFASGIYFILCVVNMAHVA